VFLGSGSSMNRNKKGMTSMRTLAFTFFVLTVASGAMAAPDSEPKPTPAVCKADLKAWSAQKTETLTIPQIDTRMTEMVACAVEARSHRHSDKKMHAYLDEFYRTHSELANRAFDFIQRRDLQGQFGEEENGVSRENASNTAAEKP
jgi:hypothetical protein